VCVCVRSSPLCHIRSYAIGVEIKAIGLRCGWACLPIAECGRIAHSRGVEECYEAVQVLDRADS
jgi:hypothetical protein